MNSLRVADPGYAIHEGVFDETVMREALDSFAAADLQRTRAEILGFRKQIAS